MNAMKCVEDGLAGNTAIVAGVVSCGNEVTYNSAFGHIRRGDILKTFEEHKLYFANLQIHLPL